MALAGVATAGAQEPQPQAEQGAPGDAGTQRGTARILGRSGCQNKPFTVRIRGTFISRVTFTIDGREFTRVRIRTGTFTIRIDPKRFRRGSHLVTALVQFRTVSGTRSRTLRLRFSRCPQRGSPNFTG